VERSFTTRIDLQIPAGPIQANSPAAKPETCCTIAVRSEKFYVCLTAALTSSVALRV